MGFQWFTTFIFVFCFSILVFNFFVLANSNLPSLQQSKPLCHDQEKIALLNFKQSFLLDCSAAPSTTVAYPKVKSWQNESDNATDSRDCCKWDGVMCDKETGHVIGLELSNSCLYGTFPHNSTLFSLNHLRVLDLSYNNFNYSQIPSDIGRLYKLTQLDLSFSVFSGQIPPEISTLSNLSVLDLSGSGDPSGVNQNLNLKLKDLSLEKLVYELSYLTELSLSQVDLSSAVPLVLSNRTSLKAISLNDCNLFGDFPPNIFQLPNLEVVSVYMNLDLRGYLPEFHSSSRLTYLSVAETKFSGELPASLGNLGSLTILDLGECKFSGQIPSSIGNLTNLTNLNLGNNDFSGPLPYSIMNHTRLYSLGLSNMMNVNSEVLKSWLPKLNSLGSLGLGRMNLGNDILPALSNLTRLQDLDLSQNQLTGQLPRWLMNMTQLIGLDLSGNQLQGPIPPWFSELINLTTLKLSLSGSVSMFDSFLDLPQLRQLYLSGVSLTFPPSLSTNSSLLKLHVLILESCNLTKFPDFLRYQDKLQILSLAENSITGAIPQWFVKVTRNSLFLLDISYNLLTSFEHPQVFLPWNNLKSLNLNNNKLQGTLPSPPSSMQVYKVSNNRINGVFPKQICHVPSLIYLDISENNLTGQIPSCIGDQLSGSMQVLNVKGNNFSGVIPQTFSRSCKLNMINLSQNQFKGKLPKSLVNCMFLEVLDVGSNHINDTFPSWLGCLPNLQVLVLRHNNFHGGISSPLPNCDFHNLRIIDLSNNFHIGNLPSRYVQSWLAMEISTEAMSSASNSNFRIGVVLPEGIDIVEEKYNYSITITNKGSETQYTRILTVLRVVDFSSNKFSGKIPKIIGNLRGLQALNLSNNNLIGGIPSSLANITDLESLDLSQNMLSGVIPQELSRLTFLGVFNVSHNRLIGPIPSGEQFNTFDNNSYTGNLALCGAPLSEKCEKDSTPQQLTDDEAIEEDTELIDWIIRSLGCISGMIIGYVIGKIYVVDPHHDWFMETFGRRGRSKTRVKRSPPLRLRRN